MSEESSRVDCGVQAVCSLPEKSISRFLVSFLCHLPGPRIRSSSWSALGKMLDAECLSAFGSNSLLATPGLSKSWLCMPLFHFEGGRLPFPSCRSRRRQKEPASNTFLCLTSFCLNSFIPVTGNKSRIVPNLHRAAFLSQPAKPHSTSPVRPRMPASLAKAFLVP